VPKLSVVIPLHNAARFIGAAIDSVLSQGCDDLEIIVIDDGSTDDSVLVATQRCSRVQCHSQPNAGIAAARNAGIRRAQGEFLAFLDADDLWPDGSLAARLDCLARQPEVECVFGALQQFISPELDAAASARIAFDPAPNPARFAGSMLIRHAAFTRVGLFDTTLKVGEMIDWLSRAELAGMRIASLDRVVLLRRIHGSNTVLRHEQSRSDYLHALKASIDRRRAGKAV
jgi:glycosyltransferase involved in cell wall biosynthesis